MFGGRNQWHNLPKETRINAYKEALSILGKTDGINIFGAVIHKQTYENDPMEYAFEQLCNRFDRFLTNLNVKSRKAKIPTQMGLIVFDKSSYETSLQQLANTFRDSGHRWGQKTRNIADVPLFVDSKATRMIQYADLIAYALRRYYVKNEREYFDLISSRISSDGKSIHGLMHYSPNIRCVCLACKERLSRKKFRNDLLKDKIEQLTKKFNK